LAGLFILRGVTIGLTRLITGRTQVFISDAAKADPFTTIMTTEVTIADADFRTSIVFWVLAAAIAAWVLGRTRFGNWIFGVGGSATAARNIGVPVARVKIILFMATAASAALLATVQVLTFGGADALRGEGKELEAITTAVIGGTFLTGGYGSVVGTAIGALALGMAQLGIFFAGIPSDWYQATIGILLLISVLINDIVRRRASEARR
jgi:simple sugar transport system permease protein